MKEKKNSIFLSYTLLSLAAAIVMGFQYVGVFAYNGILEFADRNQEAGVFRWLFWLFNSPWTDTLVQYLFLIGIAYIPAYLLVCLLPRDRQEPRKLSGKDILVSLVMAMGLGYVFNLIGTGINFQIGSLVGKSIDEMNPVTSMMDQFTPSMILYTCIVGPVMEEVLCRGFLLKRARVFGDWTAVVFTAVVFGLMHGNIAQFLYATVLGLIFGYIAVKTNSIRYTVLIHMIINSYNMAFSWGETVLMDAGMDFMLVPYTIAILFNMVVLMVSGLYLAYRYGRIWYRQMKYHDRPELSGKIFVYLNPGFFVYALLCLMEFMYYIFS